MTNLAFNTPFYDQSLQLTELVQHKGQAHLDGLIIPLIKAMTSENGWTVLLDPPETINRNRLKVAGVNLERIWILRKDPKHGIDLLAKRALEAGTCAALVCWEQTETSRSLVEQLKSISVSMRTECVLVRY